VEIEDMTDVEQVLQVRQKSEKKGLPEDWPATVEQGNIDRFMHYIVYCREAVIKWSDKMFKC
jgi:hypothetical protein